MQPVVAGHRADEWDLQSLAPAPPWSPARRRDQWIRLQSAAPVLLGLAFEIPVDIGLRLTRVRDATGASPHRGAEAFRPRPVLPNSACRRRVPGSRHKGA